MACCSFQQAMVAVVLTMVASFQQFRSACYRWRTVSIPTFLIVCDAMEASASVSKRERAWASVSMGPKRASVGPKRTSVGSKRRSASVSKREKAWASVSTSPQLVFTCTCIIMHSFWSIKRLCWCVWVLLAIHGIRPWEAGFSDELKGLKPRHVYSFSARGFPTFRWLFSAY